MKIYFYSSFIFNRLLKGYFRFLFQTLLYKKDSKSWKLLIERLRHPAGIPYAMFNAPRWNTHALIASCGPVVIDSSVYIDTASLSRQCTSWTFIAYKLPNNETSGVLTSIHVDKPQNVICLASGRYSLVMRCYQPVYPLILPAIEIDSKRVSIEQRVIKEPVDLYPPEILHRKSLFFSFAHHYLHAAFKSHFAVNMDFIEREYLPVGNPETTYKFGAYNKGQFLTIFLDTQEKEFLAYITCYNTSSFPVFSDRIDVKANGVYSTPVFDREGTYLLRLIPLHRRIIAEDLKNAIDVIVENEINIERIYLV